MGSNRSIFKRQPVTKEAGLALGASGTSSGGRGMFCLL